MEKRQEIFQNFLNKKLLITDNDMLSMQENEDESEDAESNFGESKPLHKDNEDSKDALHALDASHILSMQQENEDESEDAESNFGESQPLHKDNEHLNDALHALDASDALDAKWMDKIGYLPDQ